MKVPADLDMAARMLMHLATRGSNEGASIAEIGKTFPIGEDRIADLMERLRKGKVVRTRRSGEVDEYLLRESADKVRLSTIVDALRPRDEWDIMLTHDETEDTSETESGAGPQLAWDELEKVMLRGLEEYTLDHLSWDTAFRLDS